jgi:curved DNA-binding protein CbpA
MNSSKQTQKPEKFSTAIRMCHYKTLGIARTASKDVIRKAYLQLAKKYHPDINNAPTANAMFQKIQEAYSILSDESKKRDYDSGLGSESYSSSSGATGGASRRQDFNQRQTYKPYNEQRPPRYEEYGGFPGGAKAYWQWKAQMDAQEVEEEYRRMRDAQAREYARQRAYGYDQYDFNQQVFRERMMFGLGRILPIFIPILIIMTVIRSSVRRNLEALSQVIYDEQGRAYVRDQNGVPHRMREFDIR